MNKDLYLILGVSKTATQEAIKDAFFKKAIKYHPDKINYDNKTPEEQADLTAYYSEKYIKIQTAYKILSDPEKRKQYDKSQFNSFNDLKENFDLIEIDKTITGEFNIDIFNNKFNEKKNRTNMTDFNTKITEKDIQNKIEEREQLSVPKFLNNFNSDEFNNIFEHYHKNNDDLFNNLDKSENSFVKGYIVPYNEGQTDVFSFKNKLIEVEQDLLEDTNCSMENTGFIINDQIINEINTGKFKTERQEVKVPLKEKEIDKLLKAYNTQTEKLQNLKTEEFIIEETEVYKDFSHLFINIDKIEELPTK
jgi:curved DNA-binding protein CbpA